MPGKPKATAVPAQAEEALAWPRQAALDWAATAREYNRLQVLLKDTEDKVRVLKVRLLEAFPDGVHALPGGVVLEAYVVPRSILDQAEVKNRLQVLKAEIPMKDASYRGLTVKVEEA